MQPKIKKPFNVFEVGVGERPIGIVNKFYKASKKGKACVFTGVDPKLQEANIALEHNGASLKLIGDCALKELTKIPPASQKLIFGSYVLNYIGHYSGEKSVIELLKKAKTALAPNGRIIFVQDKMDAPWIKKLAKKAGLDFHYRELTKKELTQSLSEAVRLRATKEKRERHLVERKMGGELQSEFVLNQMMRNANTKTPSEIIVPTLMILRNPVKKKNSKSLLNRIFG